MDVPPGTQDRVTQFICVGALLLLFALIVWEYCRPIVETHTWGFWLVLVIAIYVFWAFGVFRVVIVFLFIAFWADQRNLFGAA